MLLCMFKLQVRKIMLYKKAAVLNLFFSLASIYIIYSLYSLLSNEKYSDRYILEYVFGGVFIEQAMATNRIPVFCQNIKKGMIAKYYKYPRPIFYQFVCDELGETFFSALCGSPLLLFVLACGGENIGRMIIFLLSLVLALLIAVLITLDVFSAAVLFWNYKSCKAILTAISGMFSGAMIPLIFLPDWFQTVAYYMPFSYIVDYPIRLLLGDSPGTWGIFVQCAWIAVLYALGMFIYKANEFKMNIYGG